MRVHSASALRPQRYTALVHLLNQLSFHLIHNGLDLMDVTLVDGLGEFVACLAADQWHDHAKHLASRVLLFVSSTGRGLYRICL